MTIRDAVFLLCGLLVGLIIGQVWLIAERKHAVQLQWQKLIAELRDDIWRPRL